MLGTREANRKLSDDRIGHDLPCLARIFGNLQPPALFGEVGNNVQFGSVFSPASFLPGGGF